MKIKVLNTKDKPNMITINLDNPFDRAYFYVLLKTRLRTQSFNYSICAAIMSCTIYNMEFSRDAMNKILNYINKDAGSKLVTYNYYLPIEDLKNRLALIQTAIVKTQRKYEQMSYLKMLWYKWTRTFK